LSVEVTRKLIVIIACVAALTFGSRRKWLRRTETLILGVAIIFFAFAWLLVSLVPVALEIPGPRWREILIAIAMDLPMSLALAVGLWFLIRRMRRDEASGSAKPPPARREKGPSPRASEIRKRK
jgi:hypothetical protein